ncbi:MULTISPECIES: hypothetical protein [unclassified Streptomyces]|uniref:hypothetical protein n=1 Tax=unclassified Streptomyces TaxID=2593676 RepID=UPI002473E1E3|nr:hypothetical protein [Streptomyces sp. SAI-133]
MVPGSLLRVLTLTVLLFGVVITHGVPAESAKGHLPTSVTSSGALPDRQAREDAKGQSTHRMTAADGHHDGHGPSHSGQHCTSGQLPHGSIVASSCFAASVRKSATSVHALAERGKPGFGFSGGPSFAALRIAVVLQV